MTSRLLYDRDGEPRLVMPAIVVMLAVLVVGVALSQLLRRPSTDLERAAALAQNGRYAAAEQTYARILRDAPTADAAIAFVKNHLVGVASNVLAKRVERMMNEEEVDAVLAGISDPDA